MGSSRQARSVLGWFLVGLVSRVKTCYASPEISTPRYHYLTTMNLMGSSLTSVARICLCFYFKRTSKVKKEIGAYTSLQSVFSFHNNCSFRWTVILRCSLSRCSTYYCLYWVYLIWNAEVIPMISNLRLRQTCSASSATICAC